MPRRQIPGLVFVFVFGGDIAVARGYGAAQLEPRRSVDPDRTRFRLTSVSKAITATAAFKLVEDGRLDLHRNVNAYLSGFQITEERGTVTLHHLLTHTAGFDERLTGMAARSPAGLQPLADYLARSMPPVFVEPGRVISYSNHGLGLVGLVVQQASGRPFADFVREQLFEPLDMLRSGALIGAIPDDLAVAYDFADGRYQVLSPEYLQITPAGAFFTTGADMGRGDVPSAVEIRRRLG
jgi:CubicO group peptidase (beta-lactamase class C family)